MPFHSRPHKRANQAGRHSVYPLEVDSALQSHPEVAEAISFSLAHPTLGEELVAAFVPRIGSLVDGGEVRRFLEGKLSTYKIPVSILRVEQIPKSATGKTARRSMRTAFADSFAIHGVPAESELESELLKSWRSVSSSSEISASRTTFSSTVLIHPGSTRL